MRLIATFPHTNYARISCHLFHGLQEVWATRRTCRSPLIPWKPSIRRFGSATEPQFQQEVDVPVGLNGIVKLRCVVSPSQRSVFVLIGRYKRVIPSPEGSSNVLLYLPPGPISSLHRRGNVPDHVFPTSTPEQILAETTNSTVVTIDYRLGPVSTQNAKGGGQEVHRYPTPVHDTLLGFDWVLEHLQPTYLSVFGKHVGGSLGLMLALTEAKHVRSVAAIEPICDWTGLDDFCTVDPQEVDRVLAKIKENESTVKLDMEKEMVVADSAAKIKRKSRRARAPAPPDLVPLLEAREQLFDTPSRYFDSFASPLLFLRSPGKVAPRRFPKYLTGPEYPVPVLEKLDPQDVLEDVLQFDGDAAEVSETAVTERPETRPKTTRRRKALSRWPPYGFDYGSNEPRWKTNGIRRLEVTLPWVHVYVHTEKPDPAAEPASHREKQANGSRRRKAKNAEASVLAQQADEMVSVMRRACFWGRQAGHGEKRVSLTKVKRDTQTRSTLDDLPVVSQAGEWLRAGIEGKLEDR